MPRKNETTGIVTNETIQTDQMQPAAQSYGIPQAVNQAVKGEVVEHMNNLIAVANMAQGKGLFTLEEAATVWRSIERLREIIN